MRDLIDKKRARRAFERAARSYDAHAVLQREVGQRLAARLDYVKHAPQVILDAGAGTGAGSAELAARFPQARLIALDIAHAMLRRVYSGRIELVCGDIERLPIASTSVDTVWCNLTLQWVNSPDTVFREVRRTLRPGGLFLFSTFGPDTLQELRAAWIDGRTHVSGFVDMHDLGDLLVASGLDDPVMERECVTLTYAEATDLMRDLKAIGAHNATAGRAPGLTGKAAIARVKQNYERFRVNGKLPATFEVIYAHAWKPEAPMNPTGRPVIEIALQRS
jgi:malonyl-CoA O-methyltransferase